MKKEKEFQSNPGHWADSLRATQLTLAQPARSAWLAQWPGAWLHGTSGLAWRGPRAAGPAHGARPRRAWCPRVERAPATWARARPNRGAADGEKAEAFR
jgi:hypothetical protein